MYKNNLKLPPYGHVIKAYQQECVRLNFPFYIFVGTDAKQDAYQHKCAGTLCSYLPENEPYTQFDWPVRDQKVIVYQSGKLDELYLKKFCFHLLQLKPKFLFLCGDEITHKFFKEFKNE